MGKIYQLTDELSNKIAAGEVVERPASVVKELVENSLDANSRQIRVDVEEGGLTLIRILDDGDGIDGDDLETAFFRHATSKIRNDHDLFRIATLGFRGEALPSIASVSRLTLKTCNGNHEGHEIKLEGGRITSKGSSPSRKGTEIIVTDLFYNTPARLKYLKTVHTELGHISDVVNRMALAHPEVAFHLTHNGKTLLKTMGNGDMLRVISAIYGSHVAKNMLEVKGETLDFTVKGYVAKPEVTRSNRSYMSTIINGRFIRNYPLMRAIQDGYHTLLPIGKFPIVVLHIEMDPILIDVNVHPSKLEVRLSKEQALQELVTRSLKEVFQRTRFIPEVRYDSSSLPKEKQNSEQLSLGITHDLFSKEASEKTGDHLKLKESDNSEASLQPQKTEKVDDFYGTRLKEQQYGDKEDNKVLMEGYGGQNSAEELMTAVDEKRPIGETGDLGTDASNAHVALDETSPMENDGKKEVPAFYPIGQLHGTYILAQNEKGLFIIDQHAAQERIKYEYFRDKIVEVDKNLQDLIVPLTFEVTQAEEERIKEKGHLLEEVGIFLEPFGTRTYLVRSHPTWFPRGEEQDIIEEMLEQIKDHSSTSIDILKIREEAAILMSCKAAIKANRYLTPDEMFRLLETLRMCEEPYTCPHGRPVIVHFSTYEMERMFKRVM
ncbi:MULTISPECIES: DNA mismatch repair endonuclease MutL [Bacillaceae]|uniref:DNA mismatch repair protein MutL n=1 Tax=Evansella alkalicola TaxID=745819 RepID=A0ABS6JVS8_9BACI|nr:MULTISPECIES: DNA mismatch repair endonuclease MutL [Bacillaceae]MBU9722661.1 DNA mismatch repair endonuclease MutL [Bacillus alkalicola]